MNERIVCLDIGDVRIGVAVSDPTGTIASPVEVIQRVGWGPDTKKILAVCQRYDTNRILSGLPLNMDGSEGFQAQKVRDFCRQLEKAGLQVVPADSRHVLTEDMSHFPGFDICDQPFPRGALKIAAAPAVVRVMDDVFIALLGSVGFEVLF